jgi:ATP-dependent helicase HrpB
MLDAYDDAVAVRFDPDRLRSRGIDAFAARAVDRTAQRLVPLATGLVSPRPPRPQEPEAALGVAVLAGFPDRVARRRRAGEPEVLLCGGGSATLGAESVVSEAELLVAVDAEERPRGGLFVRVASAIDAEALLEIDPDGLREETDVRWDAAGERAEASRRVSWDRLVLEETRHRGATGPEVSKRLAEEARRAGARAFVEAEALDRLLARAAFVAQAAPDAGVPALSEDDVADAIASLCEGRASFRELREADPLEAVLARLPAGARRALDAVAPERVSLPGGWSPRVEYAKGRPPWIEARVQDFFGRSQGPAVANGRVPVVLHLLAPNRRPVQVTTDLAGFWARHWPAVRRELSRRYPRHAWPEDPLAASPPPRDGRGRRG